MAEIAPSVFSSSSRTHKLIKKSRQAGVVNATKVIDVEQFKSLNGVNVVDKKKKGKSSPIASKVTSSTHASSNARKIRENFLRNFKRFDTVWNFSDHRRDSKGYASKQYSREWVKKVQSDWKILANHLPETIFVRASESRMDLLRAVIIGAEGTPYHDGLFFFDIHLPDTYPSVPPNVIYHAGGLRINPNLYETGYVCLSLLGTWTGNARENWLPKESTILQLLVSIQGLILNEKPYYNEPGYLWSSKYESKAYSENVFVLSLRTMVYSMRQPPEHFEEFVRCHFFVRAHDIVEACNAYIEGAPVGSLVKGQVQQGGQIGSITFRKDVASFMKTVVQDFVRLGVKEIEDKVKPLPESIVSTEIKNSLRFGGFVSVILIMSIYLILISILFFKFS